ncbi:MAG: chloride channel protein [Polyangiaceae bacterium]
MGSAREHRPPRTIAVASAPNRLVADAHRAFGPFSFACLAVLLGVAAGLGAFAFRMLISIIHNLFFLGRFSVRYDTSQHTPHSPWGSAIVLAPVLGGVVVVFLVKNFAPEARGHGVPEVMDAIYYGKAIIRPVVAGVKSIASAISIGSGGSVGREGPIVQISAAFASWLGGTARVSRWQRATLVAAGGGAGIAATFNTPLGGVLFAVEVLMHEVSVRTLVPVALSTATATYVGQNLFGDAPAFTVPPIHASATAAVLPAYVVLGALMALVAVVFIRALYGAEDIFEKNIGDDYFRHIVGMLGVGLAIEVTRVFGGHYYVEGVGYATIVDVLSGALTNAWMLVALAALKLMTTSLTLGSGGSGGVFSPSLFMGATLGGGFGLSLRWLFPGVPFDPAALALAGMAGLVAGATGAALTAIVMTFEMTLDYSVVLPMTLTVAVSHGLRRLILEQNIYTMKLARRGHYMPEALQANAHLVHHVGDMMMATAATLPVARAEDNLAIDEQADGPAYWVLVDADEIVGVISRQWASDHRDALRAAAPLASLVRRDFVVVGSETTLFALIATLQRARVELAVVVTTDAQRRNGASWVRGVVTKGHIAEALADGMEMFED